MKDKASSDIDWAEIIDLFASEYGWTIDYITGLDLGQIVTLMEKIRARHNKQNETDEETSPPEQDTGGDSELSMLDFETKLGGKKVVEDGITKIII